MASEDSDELVSGFSSIHRLSNLSDLDETGRRPVGAGGDEVDASCELLEVSVLRGVARMPPEERNDRLQQICPPSHDVAVQVLPVVVVPVVDKHLTHSEELMELVETGEASLSLRHDELMSHLVAGLVAASTRSARLPNEPDREASFFVYKTDHPATELDQPFLLVFRTRHFVTVGVLADVTSSARFTGFSSI
jgi:hypothetical protein